MSTSGSKSNEHVAHFLVDIHNLGLVQQNIIIYIILYIICITLIIIIINTILLKIKNIKETARAIDKNHL